TGWFERPSKRSDVARYERDVDGHVRGATVVTDTSYDDYAKLTAELVDTIAEIENRSAFTIVNELFMPESDVVRFRIVSGVSKYGLIPFEDSIRYQIAQRTMLLS